MSWLPKLYKKFLWYIGYTRQEGDEDKLSHMLARMKQRLGWVWWVLSISTIIIIAIALALLIWLLIHIAKLKVKK